jgi:glycosyltransferase involved in cell wall biosynthesis
MTATVHLDVGELVRSPMRSGIQLVERELIRHWPDSSRLVPVITSRVGFLTLPREVLSALVEGTPSRLSRFRRLVAMLRPLRADSQRLRLLNPELFLDAERARCYTDLIGAGAGSVAWIIYDFFPWLCPQYFQPGAPGHSMHYLKALRGVPHVAHISEQTRRNYEERIMRGRGRRGPVIPLGADGLGLARQRFAPQRNRYVSFGTLEPRKNVAAVLEAFARLWAEGCDAELVLVGSLGERTEHEMMWLHRLRAEPRLRYLRHADDATLRETLAGARAMVFTSEAEGFGLPPVEALNAGIPVIVSARIPSIEMLAPGGQIRLPRVDAEAVAAAVRSMQDDTTAARLWHEAARVPTHTWREFAAEVERWMLAIPCVAT